MCGLVYLRANSISAAERRARVSSALERMHYRGPDDHSIVQGDGYTMGHLRLAIVDLAGGRQPTRDPSERWTLAFNGEIYNFRELRKEIQPHWNCRDSSDTEVLLAGLVIYGDKFVTRLDGMWAFALHDAQTGDVLLSRDRFGKKPLYYMMSSGAFACASEIPALRKLLPDAEWGESPPDVIDYFRYGYALPGRTCIKGVHEVLPSHVLRLSTSGARSEYRYWSPSTEMWTGSFDQAAEQVRSLLCAAVRKRQLAADVEVGAFLSGGVDSTIICSLAQNGGQGQLRTFTAGFAEATYDERFYAAKAADEMGTKHYSEEISADRAAILAKTLPQHMGQPFGDASLIPTAIVSQVAGKHVKVVLTGDGGDEVFGGYARYVGRLLTQRYKRIPSSVRAMVERFILATPEPIAHHSGSLLKRAHLFVALARESQAEYVAPPSMRSAVMAKLVRGIDSAALGAPIIPWDAHADELKHMMLMDWLVWLPQDILAKVDRATMASSVEARSPFLDKELVELVIRLPSHWHFGGYRGKRLLRAAMYDSAPKFIWSRRKQGFASPISHWMRAQMGDELEDLATDHDTGIVDVSAIRQLLKEHRRGGVDHAQALWLVYTYFRWLQSIRNAA